MKLPYRVLVLEDDENALAGVVELLTESGFDVTAASAYDDAKRLLALNTYDLFVTDVRLRSYNGLHLVAKVRKETPETGVIIMTGYDEPLMELEASRYSAQFVRKPIKASELLEAVKRCVNSVRRERRWPRTRVAGGFRVTAGGAPAAVLDVSYGGLCLQIAAGGTLPSSFDVEVANIGLHLVVEPVWSTSTSPGALICGAALISDSSTGARTWREIVDRLSA
ncbi:MAG TPA: response regulator [Vicinamibacterales bacterium]|nr:response regulator [Vicinamibacterales bacterium]